MSKREASYKPLLFTTTVRNPKRMKGLLNVLKNFDGQNLTNKLSEKIMGELIRFGLYKPMIVSTAIKNKVISQIVLSDKEVAKILHDNPQSHKEAGFDEGWASRFATVFDFAKELGFVYYWLNEPIEFSEIGKKLADSIAIEVVGEEYFISEPHPEFEQQAFLHALAKYQRNNPFVRVLNENVPLILLLEVIQKLNADEKFNGAGISRLELPLVIFWKDNDAEALYQLIKRVRKKHGYNPSWEVIVEICVDEIMDGDFKKFQPKSIMVEYPDEFIRKMRLTGLISLRGAGRFIDINKNEIEKTNYILKKYSKYKKYKSEREYFDYMATTDENLISLKSKPVDVEENDKLLSKWVEVYSWNQIKSELKILSDKKLTKDELLKFLANPVRLEFLTTLAIKSQFPKVKVVPNYPCDDEGIPTSTAGGVGDKGDIECFENVNGILVEVTMAEGRTQTMMEVWPISRHLEAFAKQTEKSKCYFIAPTIFKDSHRQIKFVKSEDGLDIEPFTIEDFILHLEKTDNLFTYN